MAGDFDVGKDHCAHVFLSCRKIRGHRQTVRCTDVLRTRLREGALLDIDSNAGLEEKRSIGSGSDRGGQSQSSTRTRERDKFYWSSSRRDTA